MALGSLLGASQVAAQDTAAFDAPATRPLVGAVTTPDTSPPAATAAAFPWVGSAADHIYFRARCAPAQDLAPVNRRYFRSSHEAEQAGYRRSQTHGC